MTTEDDFQTALDAQPDDWQTRLVLADFLSERDDARADGYRAIAAQRRCPRLTFRPGTMCWWHCDFGDPASRSHNTIAKDWFALLPSGVGSNLFWPLIKNHTTDTKSRRECEDALARAFAQLPVERRAELLRPSAAPEAGA